jgi:hypothetical protein|tara:strand:- start:1505 stop:1936 length:432 start_codon:yes stop_codon:yes gene_type:complete
MTPENFIPFGSDLEDRSTSQFVRIAGPEHPMKEAPPDIAPVTPAEDNDLPSQIHQVLQKHLSGDSLKNTTDAIEAAISAAPARVALPEIKLTHSPTPEGEEGNEDESTSVTPPVLEYEREDDIVRRVIVNCSCGQSIHLDCDY